MGWHIDYPNATTALKMNVKTVGWRLSELSALIYVKRHQRARLSLVLVHADILKRLKPLERLGASQVRRTERLDQSQESKEPEEGLFSASIMAWESMKGEDNIGSVGGAYSVFTV